MAITSQTNSGIFVSHSSKDDAFGTRLVQDLRGKFAGENAVWYDSQGGLLGGDAWWEMIKKELTARPIFIVILSPDALTSNWVKDEVNMAWKQKNSLSGKHIIPIHYRQCKVPEDLDTLQVISFLPPQSYENAFQQLFASLNHILKQIPQLRLSFDFEKFMNDNGGNKRILPLPGSFSLPVVQKTKDQWLGEGDTLYGQNRYQDALSAYEQAIRLDSKLALAYYGKANCLYSLKDLSSALTAYEQAIQLAPSFNRSYLGKGSVLRDLQRYPEAVAAFDQFIRLSPDGTFVHTIQVERGDLLMLMRRPTEALAAYEAALRIEPNYYPAVNGKNMALQAINMNPFSNPFF